MASSEQDSDVGGTLTDAVTATLGSGAHTFEHRSCVNEHGFNIELAGFGFALIFLFPVSDSRAEEFFDLASCFLIRELQYTEGFEHFYAADHVNDIAHLAGRRGHIAKASTKLVFLRSLQSFGCLSFS